MAQLINIAGFKYRPSVSDSWSPLALNVDTTAFDELQDDVDAIEAHESFSIWVTLSATGTQSFTDSRFTANHVLQGYQFFASGSPTASTLADITYTTGAGTLSVVISALRSAGSVRLDFKWSDGAASAS